MKQGKRRTMSICLTDIPKDKIVKHNNGKLYLPIETWDYDQPDQFDNDFSVSVSYSKEELERIKAGEKINRVFIGNGRIWEYKEHTQPAAQEDVDDLPF